MKTLLLMRHAKSDWHTGAESDFERPLNDRGRSDAPRMGKALRKIGIHPSAILCSPSVRTRETAALFLDAAKLSQEPVFVDQIYDASESTLFEVLQQHGNGDTVLMIGHNPGTQRLLGSLCGGNLQVPTAALACLELSLSQWGDLRPGIAELVWFLNPRLVKEL